MTLEALACPSCASTQVKEVKDGTFFCDHCESLFKHTDPMQVTVAPSLCACGSHVSVYCSVCRGGLCGDCQATGADASWGILVGVAGYGYRLSPHLNTFGGKTTSVYRTVRHSSIVPLDLAGGYTSVVMPVAKLYSVLVAPQSVKHVCWDCLASGIPRLVEAIDQGTICEDPFCRNSPVSQCKCCKAYYCGEGLILDDEPGAIILTSQPDSPRATIGVPVHWPTGICWACAQEGTDRMAEVVRSEFADLAAAEEFRPQVLGHEGGLVPPGLLKYRLARGPLAPVAPISGSRGDLRRFGRELDSFHRSLPGKLEEIKRLAERLHGRWVEEQFDHPCDRSTGLMHMTAFNGSNGNHPYNTFDDTRPFAYVVADERDGGMPTALPGLSAGP